MTRNLKALGLALLAVFALGAIGAQGASAADEHEFHSDGERTILTGKQATPQEFTVGSVGTVKCEKATFESTEKGTQVVKDVTYKLDTITVVPKYTECTFGGQKAEVFFEDCAYIFESDTTTSSSETPGKHANVEIECSGGRKVKIHTVNCTITVAPQLVEHAVRYEKDTASSINVIATGHAIEVGKERSTAAQPVNGCLLFPTGAVGKYTGTTTAECRKDDNETPAVDRTTPGPTLDNTTTACEVTDI